MDTFSDTLLIIIVTYNTALEDCESFQAVLHMRREHTKLAIFVHDNSKEPQEIEHYEGLSISYVHDPQNPGVSKAYNVGAAYAKKNKKKWVLLLDQDTTLPATILDSYQKTIATHPDIKLVVPILVLGDGKIFSPCRYKFKRGFHLQEIAEGIHSLQHISPVNSGMLIDTTAFFEVGGYNEKVKLDFGDFQFVERFRKHYEDFYVMDIQCQQDFSNDEVAYDSQLTRFKYYCDGARHIEKDTLWDSIQYTSIVLIRGLMLTMKYKKNTFMSTYFNTFLFPK